MESYPRTNAGWQAAWARFTALEPHPVEVGLTPPGLATDPPGAMGARGVQPGRPARGLTPRPLVSRPRPVAVNPLWWLAPILIGWIGGIIAWLVNRDADPRTARNMLITGIVISVVSVIIVFSFFDGRTGLGV